MVTPIRPSLAQMLNGPAATPARPQATQQATQSAGSFGSALAAQKAFFQQVTGTAAPKITPATYTAADIAKASTPVNTTPQVDADAPPKRPGSFLNIVV